MTDAPFQSLYRRYRPQRFSEIVGQDHVVLALRNAVRDQKVAHAYLFSGPRGTGKTSAARILAKALNCDGLADGEPDGTCDSCVRIQQGNSLDVHELDAASNNGVEAMRDLVSRTALGSPGRWKVYIVDEVHMLSTAASNALLKTLEEPPAHVVFVLATTDPQKVLPTIRSRTQHFEFRLLSPELLGTLVHQINSAANLHVPEEALDLVVRRGRGSARDALSVLDQVAAAGIIDDEHEVIDEITEALCERDTGRALVAVAEAMVSGRDAQRVAVDLLEYLRNGFLALMAKQLVALPDNAAAHVEQQARRLGPAALVRAMEVIGEGLQDMRDSPEPRVTLEVALVRLTKPELDTDPAAILQRVERLESGLSANGRQDGPANSRQDGSANGRSSGAVTGRSNDGATSRRADSSGQGVPTPPTSDDTVQPPPSRPSLGALRKGPAPTTETAEADATVDVTKPPAPEPMASSKPSAELPTRDQLVQAWGDSLIEQLPQRARSRFRTGHFVAVEDGKAVFALPNSVHRDRCEEVRTEVEVVLRSHFGRHVPLRLIVESDAPARSSSGANSVDRPNPPPQQAQPSDSEEEEHIELMDTVAGGPMKVASSEERLLRAFPGAEEMS